VPTDFAVESIESERDRCVKDRPLGLSECERFLPRFAVGFVDLEPADDVELDELVEEEDPLLARKASPTALVNRLPKSKPDNELASLELLESLESSARGCSASDDFNTRKYCGGMAEESR